MDTDGDGLVDYLEDSNGNGTFESPDLGNFHSLDSDGDGLPDGWEIRHFGNHTQSPNGDPDGDGWSNLQEYQNGTDPNSVDQPLKVIITRPTATSLLP
jgi:hypothetical protein